MMTALINLARYCPPFVPYYRLRVIVYKLVLTIKQDYMTSVFNMTQNFSTSAVYVSFFTETNRYCLITKPTTVKWDMHLIAFAHTSTFAISVRN